MAVKIGSARIDENGKTTGGRAGDQTKKEVSTQNWYLHSKGWRVFRAVDIGVALMIRDAMERACNNDKIGYNQNQRSLLWSMVKDKGYDPAKCSDSSNTDCSALVRVCCAYAGIVLSDFNTSTEAGRLLSSGAFVELTDKKYTRNGDYLRRGDILVTRTKGHTVIVLTDGVGAYSDDPTKPLALGDRILRNGAEGDDVRELQSLLIQLGYDCGNWGADGDFGDSTEMAVRAYQKDSHLEVDGEVGGQTVAALKKDIGNDFCDDGCYAQIVGGNCYVRDAPNTSGKILGVAVKGEAYRRLGESEDGWQNIQYRNNLVGWVSGKYSKVVSHA